METCGQHERRIIGRSVTLDETCGQYGTFAGPVRVDISAVGGQQGHMHGGIVVYFIFYIYLFIFLVLRYYGQYTP